MGSMRPQARRSLRFNGTAGRIGIPKEGLLEIPHFQSILYPQKAGHLLKSKECRRKQLYNAENTGFNQNEPNTMTYEDFVTLLGNSLSEWFLAGKEEASLF